MVRLATTLRGAALALTLGIVAAGVASRPALADNGWHRGHERHAEWREHRWHDRDWHRHHPYVYTAPAYYAYAPPPVVYAPPPVPPSINFVFPLGHR